MLNPQCSFDVSSSRESGNEQISQIDTENVTYNFTLTYGTCESLEAYINFVLMYTTDHIFLVLQIKYLINKCSEPATPFKLATGKKPSVSYLRVLFFPRVVQKSTARIGKKALNMRHQAQKGFCGIFVGIPQH